MSDAGVIVQVSVGHIALVAEPLGRHRFVAVPRVGEFIVVHDGGEEHVLEVASVTHVGDAEESQPGKLVQLPSAEIRIRGTKVR